MDWLSSHLRLKQERASSSEAIPTGVDVTNQEVSKFNSVHSAAGIELYLRLTVAEDTTHTKPNTVAREHVYPLWSESLYSLRHQGSYVILFPRVS